MTKTQKTQVKRLINIRQEKKYLNFSAGGTGIGSTATIYDITGGINQGGGDSERSGDRIMLDSIYFKVNFVVSPIDGRNFMRCIIFQWKPNTTPISSYLLLNGPSGGIDYMSLLTVDYAHEYNILWDHTFSGVNQASNGQLMRSGFVPKHRFAKQVQYIAGGTTGTNQLYVLLISDSAAVPHPESAQQFKITYTDS